MKASNLQSLKNSNAVAITQLHKEVLAKKDYAKSRFAHANALIERAHEELAKARKMTARIKKLSANQVAIKADIKGAPKRPKAKKPDSRIAQAA